MKTIQNNSASFSPPEDVGMRRWTLFKKFLNFYFKNILNAVIKRDFFNY
jgi:hypothetical protein